MVRAAKSRALCRLPRVSSGKRSSSSRILLSVSFFTMPSTKYISTRLPFKSSARQRISKLLSTRSSAPMSFLFFSKSLLNIMDMIKPSP
jgi:hypothetical protein